MSDEQEKKDERESRMRDVEAHQKMRRTAGDEPEEDREREDEGEDVEAHRLLGRNLARNLEPEEKGRNL